MLQGEEEGSQLPHVIGVKMGEEQIRELLPRKIETGQRRKGARSTVHQHPGPPYIHPMGRRAPDRVGEESA
jgi:hypothetical protein